MNILLIGNGFDLEHGLPTKYSDFLEFCKRLEPIYAFPYCLACTNAHFQTGYLNQWNISESIKETLLQAFENRTVTQQDNNEEAGPIYEVKTDMGFLDEMYSLAHTNAWLQYFFKRSSCIGENWIDFESEISHVVQTLDYVQKHTPPGGVHGELPEPYNTCLVNITKAAHFSFSRYSNHIEALQQLTNLLDFELNRFIRAFEIYLSVFVNSIPVERTCADIEHLLPDCVLSFNYSNTYERIYGQSREISYDFIHGKADVGNTIDSCNMVLGIDEYLDDSRKKEELAFLSFKKYYQRIYKSTGNAYLTWVDRIKQEYEDFSEQEKYTLQRRGTAYGKTAWLQKELFHPFFQTHTLYIFGHSLDITDRDVLRDLICNDNVQTRIYYYREYEHDKRTLGKLIKNLVRIMGPDELIRRTGGSHKTIEFIPQTLHE